MLTEIIHLFVEFLQKKPCSTDTFNLYLLYSILANTIHLEEGDVDEGGIEVDELEGNIREFFLNSTIFLLPNSLIITTCIVANAGKIYKKRVVRNDWDMMLMRRCQPERQTS